MTQKMSLSILKMAMALVFGLFVYAFVGIGDADAAKDKFFANCMEGSTKTRGLSEVDAKKRCECVVGIMKKKLNSEQMEFMSAASTRDSAKIKEFTDKKSPDWLKKTMMSMTEATSEFLKKCEK